MHNPEQLKQSENYLERTRQVAERESVLMPEDFDSTVEELSVRLTKEEWQNEGVMVFDLPCAEGEVPAVCSISYDSSIDRNFERNVLGEELSEPISMVPGFQKIKGLTVERGQDRLDLKDILDKCSVYVCPQDISYLSPQEKAELSASEHSGFILSELDPSSTLGLFVLMHEIGHFVDRHSISHEKSTARLMTGFKVAGKEELDANDKAIMIDQERSASAFFVKNMRKFLDKETMGKINKIGIQRGIKSYHDGMEEK